MVNVCNDLSKFISSPSPTQISYPSPTQSPPKALGRRFGRRFGRRLEEKGNPGLWGTTLQLDLDIFYSYSYLLILIYNISKLFFSYLFKDPGI